MTYHLLALIMCAVLFVGEAAAGEKPPSDLYTPIKGGWHTHVTSTAASPGARLDRRPLFPPADKSMILDADGLKKTERYGFRPIIVAYNEPRFLFDLYSAGGLMGHLYVGLTSKTGASKWFHQWSDLDVSYVDGRMDYKITDPAFPGVVVSLSASPLAHSAGLILKVQVTGLKEDASLVWMYGGASGFFTNWNMGSPEFSFAPKHCALDLIGWRDGAFTLTRGFDKRVEDFKDPAGGEITGQPFAIPNSIPGWKAVIHGGSTWKGRAGFGDPNKVANSPSELVNASEWAAPTSEKNNCVAVQEAALTPGRCDGYVAVGLGGDIEDAIRTPDTAWKAAMNRNGEIAKRIVTHTPDPYLDAAVPMMAFLTEGTWADTAYVHGGWSWRFAYLGWRILYGPVCYGWTDRVAKSIRSHVRMGLITDGPDKGAIGCVLEWPPGVYYNMDEVFVDMVRNYLDYTNDTDLARELFPIIEGIVEWENRRLRPSSEYLYESALNTWVSDQHWYTRGLCTTASAYVLRMNSLLAELAERLGKDPKPYRQRAARIREAMQRRLWMQREGVFAEYQDTLGACLLHPQPELATIYHSAEFGAADALQVYQMLHWGDTHLKVENTPGGGKQYWSSNWFPNYGRSYTHSTYEMAYGEELNYACTNYLAGRSDEAFSLFRASLCGIFSGPTPGGLSCHAYADGRQRANDEFADASSMWGRTLVEGLFGIQPKRPQGFVELSPQFPSAWPKASIETKHFSYKWTRDGSAQSIQWQSPVRTSVHLRLPIRASAIDRVTVDGKPAKFKTEPGVEVVWVLVDTPVAKQGKIEVVHTPDTVKTPAEVKVKVGDPFEVKLKGATAWTDPQGILYNAKLENGALRGVVKASPGPALLFVSTGAAALRRWVPVRLLIEPREPAPPQRVWKAPTLPDRDLNRWVLIDPSPAFNASVPEVVERVLASVQPPPLPASEVNTGYYKYHLSSDWISPKLTDEAWRKKVGSDGVAWTTDGIPFKTRKDGPNIAAVSLAGGFPASVEFPANGSGKTLYLMISGLTFAMQSHVPNIRVTLDYADGTSQAVDLVNPFTIGDCWGQYHFHDTAANGFENIGGRSGPAGSSEAGDLTKPINVDCEAHLVPFELRSGVDLKSISLEAVANDVVFGIMGATILK